MQVVFLLACTLLSIANGALSAAAGADLEQVSEDCYRWKDVTWAIVLNIRKPQNFLSLHFLIRSLTKFFLMWKLAERQQEESWWVFSAPPYLRQLKISALSALARRCRLDVNERRTSLSDITCWLWSVIPSSSWQMHAPSGCWHIRQSSTLRGQLFPQNHPAIYAPGTLFMTPTQDIR